MFALRKIFLALGFLILVLLEMISPRTAVLAFQTWRDVHAIQSALVGEQTNFTTAARALLHDARQWRVELAPFIANAPQFAWLPFYGGDLAQAQKFAALADELFNASEPTLELYDALNENLASQHSFGAALLDFSRANAAQIESARDALSRAQQARAQIDERELSPKAHALLRMIDRALNDGNAALLLLQMAPQLLGDDAPRRYLILAQNNDELRATGGFISAIGVLRVERGEISVEWFGDSFAADDLSLIHSPPPRAAAKIYVGVAVAFARFKLVR